MGASRGIGRGIAGALAREGARVAIASRSPRAPRRGGGGDRRRGGGVRGRHRRPRSDGRAAGRGRGGARPGRDPGHQHGRAAARAARSTNPRDEWEQAYRSLVLAPRVLVEAALPGMRERGWGRIVNVGSTSVRRADPGPGPLERAPDGGGRLPEDARRARSPATGSRSTRSPPGASRPTGWPPTGARWEEMERARRARTCPPAGSGRRRSTATWSPSSAPSAPRYLTGTVIPLDGGLLRST